MNPTETLKTKWMQATAPMASVMSTTLRARRIQILGGLPLD